jgi:two-component system OmpR family response regulator
MKHILVVDDDADVLSVLVEMIRDAGCSATPANGGVAMRKTLASEDHRVDAVVLDCLLSGEPSAQLALHAKSLHLPVVMISGNVEAMKFADDHGLQLLWKPFHAADLMAAINEAMNSGEFGQRDSL